MQSIGKQLLVAGEGEFFKGAAASTCTVVHGYVAVLIRLIGCVCVLWIPRPALTCPCVFLSSHLCPFFLYM